MFISFVLVVRCLPIKVICSGVWWFRGGDSGFRMGALMSWWDVGFDGCWWCLFYFLYEMGFPSG